MKKYASNQSILVLTASPAAAAAVGRVRQEQGGVFAVRNAGPHPIPARKTETTVRAIPPHATSHTYIHLYIYLQLVCDIYWIVWG